MQNTPMKKSWMTRIFRSLHKDTDGSVLLEATLVMPVIVVLIAGIADYGVTLYQYHTLSTATSSALRQLIVSRGFNNPYASTIAQYKTWAPNIAVTSSQVTVSVEDPSTTPSTMKTCTDVTTVTCKTLLDAAAGKQATVKLNYACKTTFLPNIASPCPIKITMSGMIE
jgi:Flp pilus assembly protein TadG